MADGIKSIGQFKTLLVQILDSYENISHIKEDGGTAESLRKELQSIMNSFAKLPHTYELATKETPNNSDFLMDIMTLMKIPFLTTLKMQIGLLSLEDVYTTPELVKDQANLTITTMNLSNSFNKLKKFLASYSIVA